LQTKKQGKGKRAKVKGKKEKRKGKREKLKGQRVEVEAFGGKTIRIISGLIWQTCFEKFPSKYIVVRTLAFLQ
jgi:hypothetical protein